MNVEVFRNSLVLTGPTGCGKSGVSLELAEQLNAEIVSMDSMTIYRGMNIGTAKLMPDQRRGIPHHLIDVLDPWESASVAWWLDEAAKAVQDIERRGKRVIFVGGTPLYLKALLYGLFDGPAGDDLIRERLMAEARNLGLDALHRRLAEVDPLTAVRLHPNDLRRVVRALEVAELTGRPLSSWQEQWHDPRRQSTDACNKSRVLWLDLPRQELYARINTRVIRMMEDGLLDEVRSLQLLPRPPGREAAQALGYKELFDYLNNRCTLADAITQVQTRSRNFAKRQITWFRHISECVPATRELTFSAWGLRMDS